MDTQAPQLDKRFAIELLIQMLSIESLTCNEGRRADYLTDKIGRYKNEYGFRIERVSNNIIIMPQSMQKERPTLLMVSHIDTVPPAKEYSFNPLEPFIKEDKIYGLGSNDDGGSVVCMITTVLNYLCRCKEMQQNNETDSNRIDLILVLSAEEEKSGSNGLILALNKIKEWSKENSQIKFPDFAIVGEPTGFKMAIGERGLLVIDCVAEGKAGHVAIGDGENAIYKAIDEINRLRQIKFPKISPLFGEIKINTTIFNSGTLHNIVPAEAKFTADIRTTECYSNREIVETISKVIQSRVTARNLNNKTSITPQENPYGALLLRAGALTDLKSFLSPTTSDWMRLEIPAIKLGPGDSARSHKADEYITTDEIERGIELYTRYIDEINRLI